jgi:DNA-binding transcriptional MerR regulator
MSTHTIGEVLNRLKGEFDDITISKIRFLESEGLISPDRTESGYRKFTDDDVERLRYVLRAQRDRYLPLKVIKQELARIDAGEPPLGPDPDGSPTVGGAAVAGVAAGQGPASSASTPPVFAAASAEVVLSARELAESAGLSEADLGALRDHALLGDGPTYDGDDLRVAQLAAQLLAAGLEARHLRMYRQFAEREAALAEQLVAPLLRQRNPDSRRQAEERAELLATVGGGLHRALLAEQLRSMLRP